MNAQGSETLPALVVGAGVAGISAALDLARAGKSVHLVERGADLGGQTARLDKLYPTDHCGFCPVWSEIRLCRQHPRVHVHTDTTVDELRKVDGFHLAVLKKTTNFIDSSRCIFCGRCARECPLDAVAPTDPHTYPPVYRIDPSRCNRCGRCIRACPTEAIALDRPAEKHRIRIQGIIRATGFEPADLSPATELGGGTHPDIMAALAFEAWTAGAGPNRGRVLCHDGRPARKVAFIQCAGARDRRIIPHCNTVCCMHALKQARWVRRRNPECRCVIFFTDLRTEGRGYETYYRQQALETGIELIRARPGRVCPLPGGRGIALKYEDTLTRNLAIEKFDMVVLNGGLQPVMPPGRNTAADGSMEAVPENDRTCGFCKAPADVEMAAVQGSATAMDTLLEADA